HALVAIAAMDAGKHAITDKAMCLTVEEARAMIEARDRSGVLLSAFHNRRWDPISQPRWYVLGEHATLLGQDLSGPLRINGIIGGIEGELSVPLIKGEWQSFYQNIADTLAGREEVEVKPEQLVPQIAIAQAAYRSIASQQVIPVD